MDFSPIDRRRFITSALIAIGVAGAALSDSSILFAAKAGKKRYFTASRFAILDAVTETIMPRTDTPGARDVLVPQRFDALMTSWASPQTRIDFTRILDEIDAAAKGIVSLSPAKQLEVVAAYDRLKMADRAYSRFKNLGFALYYMSEAGATQELRYEHSPGAWDPSIPVTSDTRGYAHDVSFGGN